MKFICFVFVFLSFKISAAPLDEIANHPTWLRLLHWDGNSSRIDAPDFFLAPNGSSDAMAELVANIEAFQNNFTPANDPWPAACSFVARYKFLQEMGIKLPQYECSEYRWWRENLAIKSVSMVFSSYYVGNPASIFGHTFLKLNFTADHRSKLTDYAVTFAANATDNIGFVYAAKGLFGGYQGFYAIDPYYMKVNEYVHTESRDLWEYPLELDTAQIDRLLAHLWELTKKGWFWYWFADENCSFQLLSLLDVAYGSTQLAQDTPAIVLPTDTIKVLRDNNKLGKGSIRPSQRKLVNYRHHLAETQSQEHLTLDAKIAQARFDKNNQQLKELLTARSQIKIPSPAPTQDWLDSMRAEDPTLAHDPSQVSIATGVRQDKFYTRIGARLGLHSVTDQSDGLPRHSELVYGGVNFDFSNQRFRLHSIDGIRVFSPEPLSAASYPWTWRVDLEASRFLYLPDKVTPSLRGLIGKTLAKNNYSFYAMLGAQAMANKNLINGHELGATIESGLIFSAKHLRAHAFIMAMQAIDRASPVFEAKVKIQTNFSRATEFALQYQRVIETPYQAQKDSDELLAMLLHHF